MYTVQSMQAGFDKKLEIHSILFRVRIAVNRAPNETLFCSRPHGSQGTTDRRGIREEHTDRIGSTNENNASNAREPQCNIVGGVAKNRQRDEERNGELEGNEHLLGDWGGDHVQDKPKERLEPWSQFPQSILRAQGIEHKDGESPEENGGSPTEDSGVDRAFFQEI